MNDILSVWTAKANQVLLNKKIVQVRYLSDAEQQAFGWHNKCVVFQLDDGTLVFPCSDDEGNNAGTLHWNKEENWGNLPTL